MNQLLIDRSEADGILKLAAQMLADARVEAAAGCPEARRWIERCALGYLSLLARDTGHAERLHNLMLSELEQMVETTEEPAIDPASMTYEQAALAV